MTALLDFIDASPEGKLDMFEEAHGRMVEAEARVAELENALREIASGPYGKSVAVKNIARKALGGGNG